MSAVWPYTIEDSIYEIQQFTYEYKNNFFLQLETIVLNLLEDIQPEVRVKSSRILSGMLHCRFIPDPDNLLVSIPDLHPEKSQINYIELVTLLQFELERNPSAV